MPSVLGGSPLGLLMVNSGQKNGFATFNSTTERSINVNNYNGQRNNAASSGYGNSLFSGARIVRAWPGIKEVYSNDDIPGLGDLDSLKDGGSRGDKDPKFKPRRNLHNNDVYDTTILNIIDNLKGTKAMLKMADFAYLKDLGVYPNNRLMVARRFVTAQTDNIYKNLARRKNGAISEINPMAVLISWVSEADNFLEISFGEKWTEAKASFTDILNSIGGDITSKASGLGAGAEGGGGLMPLPGFTEIFQRQFLANIGILDEGSGNYIPSGNPNLIKEAKVRQTVGYDAAGSGLECTVSIKMECEYEQKFISGLDPTIVWMDLIGNITRFATSPSINYGLSSKASGVIGSILDNPMGFVKKVVSKISEALNKVKDVLMEELNKKVEKLKAEVAAKREEEKNTPPPDGKTIIEKVKNGIEQKLDAALDEFAQGKGFIDKIGNFIADALKGLAMKYRVEIMGVVNSLSGLPSTPWHITVGNPMRPVFCAGDMYMRETLSLTLGPLLAFNDLPSSIKASFTLTNARPWGMQEIMAKFNSGYIRSVDVQKSFYETNYIDNGGKTHEEKAGNFPYDYENVQTESIITGSVSNINNATNVSGGSVSNPAMANFLAQKQAGQTQSTTQQLNNQGTSGNQGAGEFAHGGAVIELEPAIIHKNKNGANASSGNTLSEDQKKNEDNVNSGQDYGVSKSGDTKVDREEDEPTFNKNRGSYN